MATRTLEIDLRQGTGASSEPMYGVVTVQRAKAKSAGGFEILPFETSLKLINGKATITEAETDGTGPFYDSVYLFRVQNGYCAPRWGFMAALPDGSTPITTGELPMVDPITGEGIYMDAQEWNALYGDLPDRVSSLETGKANTSHTHAIGDVTGLQTALNTKGNATMRVDTTVGTRVFITDGVTERMISGKVSRKLTTPDYINGWAVDLAGLGIYLSRIDDLVTLEIPSRGLTGASATSNLWLALPMGFRRPSGIGNYGIFGYLADGTLPVSLSFDRDSLSLTTRGLPNGMVQWRTTDPWPTTLPGVPG